jgi:hypothetical protein
VYGEVYYHSIGSGTGHRRPEEEAKQNYPDGLKAPKPCLCIGAATEVAAAHPFRLVSTWNHNALRASVRYWD